MQDFERSTFTHEGSSREVLCLGEGPAVVVMPEMPGVTPRVADFARRVAALGCSVRVPVLFGEPGRDPSGPYILRSIVPCSLSSEFAAFAKGRTAPVVEWLRALASEAYGECGGAGVGAVGMCFTGGLALGMCADEHLVAPVLSQPSLPLSVSGGHKAALQLSPEDLVRVQERIAGGLRVMGFRFSHDKICPPERFETLRRELGGGFVGTEIDSSPGNPHGIRKAAHSVLTEDLVDEPGHPTRDALDGVLDLFRERLLGFG